jgi:hypothetical protein
LLLLICAICGFVLLSICSPEAQDPGKPIMLVYLRRIKPGMSVAQVRRLFPSEMLAEDRPVGSSVPMTRRFTQKEVARRLFLWDPNTIGLAICEVYFDRDGRIVGFYYTVSSAGRLRRDELWFPGTVSETGTEGERK